MLTSSTGVYSCFPDDMGNFFLQLVIVLIAGFGVGVISHDSLKTFRLFMRIYVYILLPCGIICGVFGLYFNRDHRKQMKLFSDVIIAETITKFIIWTATVVSCWFLYKSKKSLVYGAICGQFLIQGNNVGYALSLYRNSCNETSLPNGSDTVHNLGHGDPIVFDSLSYFSTYINFLIFLPLSHGVITLAKRKGSMNSLTKLRLFKEAFLYQQSQVCLSTSALIISVAIILVATLLNGPGLNLHTYNSLDSGPITLSHLAMILLTLSTGVYFHHLLFHLDISKVCMRSTITLTVIISFIYPAIALIIHELISHEELAANFEIVIIQYSVPTSPYSQHFALKHSNDPISLIVAFFASTFLSPVIGLATVLVEKVHSDNTHTPIQYYTDSQRNGYLIISLILISITVVMSAKINQEGKKRMIFLLAINEALSMSCKIAATAMIEDRLKDSHRHDELAVFGMILFCHLVCNFLTVRLLAMISFPSFSKKKYNLWISAAVIYSVSVIIPLCLCLMYMDQYEKFDMSNIDYLLDFNDTNYGHQRASITYITANTVMMIAVATMIIYYFNNTTNRRSMSSSTPFDSTTVPSTSTQSSTYNQRRVEDEGEVINESITLIEKEEEYTVKRYLVFIAFQTVVVFIMTVFQVWRAADYLLLKGDQNFNYRLILDTFGLVGTIFSDCKGFVMFLLFTISVGDMKDELARYRELFKTSYIAVKCRTMWSRPNIADVEPTDLPWEVIDSCRKFVLYHKDAFLYWYPATGRNGKSVFKGEDLVSFLWITGVADSKETAMYLGNSYLQGRVMVADSAFIGWEIEINCMKNDGTTYIFNSGEDIPDFEALRKQVLSPFTYFNDQDII